MSEFSFYIGIDLGNTKQAICVLDENGATVCRRVVEEHEVLVVIGQAIGEVSASAVAVAVEDRNNVVVEALLDLEFAVHTINPKQADLFRGRMTASGAKDDKRDALVLARALMSDPECFRHLVKRPGDEEQLRTNNHAIEQLDAEYRRTANQLRAAVLRFFPALLSLCEGADEPWFWAMVLMLKDVDHGRRVHRKRIDACLVKHRKRAVTTDDIVTILKLPLLKPSTATSAAGLDLARALIERLQVMKKQQVTFSAKRVALLKELAKPTADGKVSDTAIILTMPGVGPHVAATLVAECGSLLHGDHALLRAIAGVAPVTTRSGRLTRVTMRKACNSRIRDALHHAAFTASIRDEQFKADRARHLANGHSPARALRSIADKMLAILVAMLKARTFYVPKGAVTAQASSA